MSEPASAPQPLRQATIEEMEQVVADHYGVSSEYAAGMAEEFGPGWVRREFIRIMREAGAPQEGLPHREGRDSPEAGTVPEAPAVSPATVGRNPKSDRESP